MSANDIQLTSTMWLVDQSGDGSAWFWECAACHCAFGPLLLGEWARPVAEYQACEHIAEEGHDEPTGIGFACAFSSLDTAEVAP